MQKIAFESKLLGDGHLDCPKDVMVELSKLQDVRIKVTLEFEGKASVDDQLGVTEAEIHRMMELQGKSREVVVNFLRAAGSLADDKGFERRVKDVRRRGNRWRTPMLS